MHNKIGCKTSLFLALFGNILIFLGVAFGKNWAFMITKPHNISDDWLTSNELINALTILPIVLGATILIFSFIIFSITFWNNAKETKK